ncbi:hypothetical protein CMT48_17235 [Elizabethkingia anophelis]|uniref:hypothetical protein n=1 Tax=Elizabethkingia anophelis TaxID=1117645 RepID=UPI00293CBD22|nr:hypothetical protein [Elizabethkingia anophelis]MDV3982813.1 hypothetical protein [Elizabethkingia anophelis]HAY3504317.1 hypothetical protein [Elizabethkingia anophelis]HAY3512294.1 hypothetical protein [Elizabethkingia anophelis]HAY3516546.1 hypothetical protein [Elizabethkingia anophelis]
MSEFKGTKGKWEFHESKGLFITTVGAIFRKDKSRLEQRSNAKLISKAPEMLEMLKRCEVRIEPKDIHISLLNDLRQLIKEATE